jgi:hypothetical protein
VTNLQRTPERDSAVGPTYLASILNWAPARPKAPSPNPVSTFLIIAPIATRSMTTLLVFVAMRLPHAAVPAITPAVMHGFKDTFVEQTVSNASHACVGLRGRLKVQHANKRKDCRVKKVHSSTRLEVRPNLEMLLILTLTSVQADVALIGLQHLDELISIRFLSLHAQDVIGPVPKLGTFDHSREPRELLLSVLHPAQITNLWRIGASEVLA